MISVGEGVSAEVEEEEKLRTGWVVRPTEKRHMSGSCGWGSRRVTGEVFGAEGR